MGKTKIDYEAGEREAAIALEGAYFGDLFQLFPIRRTGIRKTRFIKTVVQMPEGGFGVSDGV